MDETQQLIAEIESGRLTVAQLEQIAQSATEQIARYAEGREIIERSGSDNWTYEAYVAVMGAVGANQSRLVGLDVWDQMFNKDKLELRASAIEIIEEGQGNFRRVQSEVSGQLESLRQTTAEPSPPKRWWRPQK